MDITRYAPGHTINHLLPVTPAQAHRALRDTRGDADNAVRYVSLRLTKLDNATVNGPADGRPLLIDVRTGNPHLTIESGNVVLHADSAWGNTVTVNNDATLTVITTSNRKVTADVHDTATLTVYAAGGSHGYLATTSPEATITVNGIGHRHTVSTAADYAARMANA